MSKPCPSCGEPIEANLFLGGRGRKPLLTEELCDKICAHIERGATLRVAAGAEDVHRQRLYEWKERGREDPDGIYGQFPDKIARAECRFETNILARLDSLDDSTEAFDRDGNPFTVNKIDPKIAASLSKSLTWLLERCRRERYGASLTVKVEEAKLELIEALAIVAAQRQDDSLIDEVMAVLEPPDDPSPQRAQMH